MLQPILCPHCNEPIYTHPFKDHLNPFRYHKCIEVTRWCKKCGKEKPINDFEKYRVGVKSQGDFFRYGNICKDCYYLHVIIPNQIRQQIGIDLKNIRKNPSLIQAWAQQQKNKKLLKTKKHENTKTS